MADEATIRSGLQILKRDSTTGITLMDYQGRPQSFTADVDGTKGPTPGAITVSAVSGTDIDLSELTTPGLCRLMNMDANNPIHVGRYDPDSQRFYPLIKLLPGETYVVRLSDLVEDEWSGTGTGTTSTASTFRAYAENADSVLSVEAFES